MPGDGGPSSLASQISTAKSTAEGLISIIGILCNHIEVPIFFRLKGSISPTFLFLLVAFIRNWALLQKLIKKKVQPALTWKESKMGRGVVAYLSGERQTMSHTWLLIHSLFASFLHEGQGRWEMLSQPEISSLEKVSLTVWEQRTLLFFFIKWAKMQECPSTTYPVKWPYVLLQGGGSSIWRAVLLLADA